MTRSRLYTLAIAAWMACFCSGVHAQHHTGHDIGGRIGTYIEKYAAWAASGQRVIVDGACLSACTLLLGIVPRKRACATPGATFGFHAAWLPGPDGRPVKNAAGTQALMQVYTSSVKTWLKRKGGLREKMVFTRATTFLPRCPSAYADAPRNVLPGIVVRPGTTASVGY